MFNKQTQMLDLHFISFKYRESYLRRILGHDSELSDAESLLKAKQLSTECLYPSLIENSRFSAREKTFNRNMRTLRASRLGVVRLELS